MDFLRRWKVSRDLRRARALEGEGYIEAAAKAWEAALAEARGLERAEALRGLGACGLRLGRLAKAREALAEAVKLVPEDPDCRLLLGRVLMELRDTAGAEEALHEGLKAAPDRVDLLMAQAEVYAIKFPRAALEAGKRVLERTISHPEEVERVRFPREYPAVFLRNLAVEQRFQDEAAAYFDEVAAKGGWMKAVALNHKGILWANTGKLDEAVKVYQEVLAADPGFDAAHFNLGMAHARRRDFDAARTAFAVWAKRRPHDAVTTYGFGFIAETKPDVPEMIRLYAFLLERAKSNPPTGPELGRLDVARGWLAHVETVLAHAKRHAEESHPEPGAN